MWSGIEEMRKNTKYTAAVDTMGCAVEIAPKKFTKAEKAYHCLVGLMMSSQTKDEVTHATLRYLVEERNLSIPTILETKESDLNEWIKKVGFHNKKAVYIKKTTEQIQTKHNGKVPSSYDDLIALPGVGPKMAHLVLQTAFGKVEGVSVDVHVHRICNRMRWAGKNYETGKNWKPCSTPGETAKDLEEWLPKEKWTDINHMLVGFG